MPLALMIGCPALAVAAGLALVAAAPPSERYAIVRPALQTVLLLTAATVYIAALWSHP